MVAIGSRDRPHIGRSTQGLPLVGSSLKSAISRQIRKEEMRNDEVIRGRQDSRIRKRKATATACTCQPSLGDKGTPILGPPKQPPSQRVLHTWLCRKGKGYSFYSTPVNTSSSLPSSEGIYAAQLLHGHQQAALLGQRPAMADDGFSTSSHHR